MLLIQKSIFYSIYSVFYFFLMSLNYFYLAPNEKTFLIPCQEAWYVAWSFSFSCNCTSTQNGVSPFSATKLPLPFGINYIVIALDSHHTLSVLPPCTLRAHFVHTKLGSPQNEKAKVKETLRGLLVNSFGTIQRLYSVEITFFLFSLLSCIFPPLTIQDADFDPKHFKSISQLFQELLLPLLSYGDVEVKRNCVPKESISLILA